MPGQRLRNDHTHSARDIVDYAATPPAPINPEGTDLSPLTWEGTVLASPGSEDELNSGASLSLTPAEGDYGGSALLSAGGNYVEPGGRDGATLVLFPGGPAEAGIATVTGGASHVDGDAAGRVAIRGGDATTGVAGKVILAGGENDEFYGASIELFGGGVASNGTITIHGPLATVDPGVAGEWWSDNGVVKISAG